MSAFTIHVKISHRLVSKYLTVKIFCPDCIISCKRNSKGSRMKWNSWISFLFQGIILHPNSLLSIFNRFIFCRRPSSETFPEIDNLSRCSNLSLGSGFKGATNGKLVTYRLVENLFQLAFKSLHLWFGFDIGLYY